MLKYITNTNIQFNMLFINRLNYESKIFSNYFKELIFFFILNLT